MAHYVCMLHSNARHRNNKMCIRSQDAMIDVNLFRKHNFQGKIYFPVRLKIFFWIVRLFMVYQGHLSNIFASNIFCTLNKCSYCNRCFARQQWFNHTQQEIWNCLKTCRCTNMSSVGAWNLIPGKQHFGWLPQMSFCLKTFYCTRRQKSIICDMNIEYRYSQQQQDTPKAIICIWKSDVCILHSNYPFGLLSANCQHTCTV